MASEHRFLRQIDRLFRQGTMAGLNERDLIERLTTQHDPEPLSVLVERHGPMVLGVCRRVLANPHDVEDAFQATFLILVRKADGLRDHHRLGSWLYSVAYRVATRARADVSRRRELEQRGARFEWDTQDPAPECALWHAEVGLVVDQELARLPASDRAVIVACDLEGQAQEQAARRLGLSEGALRGRLARARRKLRERLIERGVAPSSLPVAAPLLSDGLTPSVPPALLEATTRAAAASLLAGRAAPSATTIVSVSVANLVQGVIRAMNLARITSLTAAVVLAAAGLLLLGGLVQARIAGVADTQTPPGATQTARAEAEPAPAAQKPGLATLEFRTVRQADKQPIAGVAIQVSYSFQNSWHQIKQTTDAQGRSRFALPEGLSSLRVSSGKDGFALAEHSWNEKEIRQGLPPAFTQELEPGLPIGGFVKDEAGQPVPRAEVTVAIAPAKKDDPDVDVPARGNMSIYAAFPSWTVKTDDAGRWRCSILPDRAEERARLWFWVEHPDHVSDTGGYSRRLSLKTARAMTGTLLMRRGIRASGQVHDGKGRFVSDATVILAYSGSTGNCLRTTTDAAGQFIFPHADDASPLGRFSVSAQADGFSPAWQMVVPTGDIPLIDFALAPGKTFRGRVVDGKGRPVAGAQVEPKWQECYFLDWKATTDEDGRFVWLSAPAEGEIEFQVRKDGFLFSSGQRIAARAGDVTITIHPQIRVHGSVVDAETGRPIPEFRVVDGQAVGNRIVWGRRGTAAHDGRFDVSPFHLDRPGIALFVQIVADGYLPASSRAIVPGESNVALDFKLKKGAGLAGTVKLPDGARTVGADVYLNSPKYGFPLENNRQHFAALGSNWLKTNDQGVFAFPAQDEPFGVIVVHSKGVAQKSAGELAKSSELILEPYGRVEGDLRIGGEPGVKQAIRLRLDRSAYARDHLFQFFDYTAVTDRKGHFSIEDVMPGEAVVSRSVSLPGAGQVALNAAPPVDVKPGQTVRVEIGGHGRPVTGKVTVPATARKIDLGTATGLVRLKRPAMPRPEGFMSWDQETRFAYSKKRYLSAEGKAYRRAGRLFQFSINTDGSFRIDDVPGGSYELTIFARNAPGFQGVAAGGIQVQGTLEREVTVEPALGGRSDEPLDLGSLDLELKIESHRQLAVGEPVPAFEVKTLDGKPLRLGEFRGKFVLLDFWATWCGPCLEQEPHLQAVFDAFDKDGRFVMISLSLDDQAETAKAYAAKHGLKWAQGFLGQAAKVTDQYGVTSIPQIMLVGPDGKLVTANLSGLGIKAAVSQALKRQN